MCKPSVALISVSVADLNNSTQTPVLVRFPFEADTILWPLTVPPAAIPASSTLVYVNLDLIVNDAQSGSQGVPCRFALRLQTVDSAEFLIGAGQESFAKFRGSFSQFYIRKIQGTPTGPLFFYVSKNVDVQSSGQAYATAGIS